MQVQSLLFVSFLTRKWPRGWLYVCFVRLIRSFRYAHSTVHFPKNSLRKLSSQRGSSKRKHPCLRTASQKKRRFHHRKTENVKAITSSCHAFVIADHVTSTGHNSKWDHFDILEKGRSDTHCKMKETLLMAIETHLK